MNNWILTVVLSLLFSIFPVLVSAFGIMQNDVPGGVVKINLSETSAVPPEVFFQDQRVMVVPQNTPQHWQAIVGIPLHLIPGKYTIEVLNQNGDTSTQSFTLDNKEYPSQHITLQPQGRGTPDPTLTLRIIQEQKKINNITDTWENIHNPPLTFISPIQGRISSEFGLKRFFNGVQRNPHSGIDIAAELGTPIKSTADGVVVNAGDYFYSGNTVFIDHGQGLLSVYCHLSKIKVTLGNHVKQGQIIGKVGMTGRATGPHLHWGIILNGARVDPTLFVNEQMITMK